MKRILLIIWQAIKTTFNIIINPSKSLENIDLCLSDDKKIWRLYIAPMEVVCSLMCCLSLIITKATMAHIILNPLILFGALTAGFFACNWVFDYINKLFKVQLNTLTITQIVAALSSVVYMLNIFESFITDAFFIRILYVYILYIAWIITDKHLTIENKNTIPYLVTISFFIIGIPIILMWLIHKILI